MAVVSFHFADNSSIAGADGKAFESTELFDMLRDQTLADLAKNRRLFLFSSFDDSDDLDGNQGLLSRYHGMWWTTNVMGFLGYRNAEGDDEELVIGSRFAGNGGGKDGADHFLRYLLCKVFRINLTGDDWRMSTDRSKSTHDLLAYLFPTYLHSALAQGEYREYVHIEHNDMRVRGAIDVARHIKSNMPLGFPVAYATNERTSDNPVLELARHTAEFIKEQGLESSVFSDSEYRKDLAALRWRTPSYDRARRRLLIDRNRRIPVRNELFSAYRELQRLCLAILTHNSFAYCGADDRMHGILFDGAWLWERYLSTLLDRDYYHPDNKTGAMRQHMFLSSPSPSSSPRRVYSIYPDFISREAPYCIADAKYKFAQKDKRNDYLQMVAYMYRFESTQGYLMYPDYGRDIGLSSGDTLDAAREDGDRDMDLVLMRGLDTPGIGRAVPSGAIHLNKVSMDVPRSANDYEEFCKLMRQREERFIETVCFRR